MPKNIMRNAFFVLTLTIAFVVLYPFLHTSLPFLNDNFKRYSLFDNFLLPEDTARDSFLCEDDNTDSLSILLSTPLVPQYAGTEFLIPFFKELQQKNEQTRIAYYGDSVIEGDLVSQTLRDSLQKRFGGYGVGFVPAISRIGGFRRSLNQHFSGDWEIFNVLKSPPEDLIFGYLGETFCCANTFFYEKDSVGNIVIEIEKTIKDSVVVDSLVTTTDSLSAPTVAVIDTVKAVQTQLEEQAEMEVQPFQTTFIASRRFAGVSTLAQANLYYGKSNVKDKVGSVHVKMGDTEKKYVLGGKQTVNKLQLNTPFIRKIAIEYEGLCNHQLYGLSFESQTGVIVDNIPSRGNSGSGLMRLHPSVMNEFQATLGIDLVILQFGMNVLNVKMTDYSWYATEMNRVVKNMKAGFPGVAILIIGPPDHGVKLDGITQTNPSVEIITGVLRDVAEKNEAAFFSFYEAMGGKGSMVKWVEGSEPKLANSDYTHFNFKGAEKAGGFLLTFLLEAFDEWVEQK